VGVFVSVSAVTLYHVAYTLQQGLRSINALLGDPLLPACAEMEGRKACKGIHQVIVGGETGKDARPMHPDWVRSVRDQCEGAGVPFFFKSWGEWATLNDMPFLTFRHPPQNTKVDGIFKRVGKKAAGRLLDGREHNDLAWRI